MTQSPYDQFDTRFGVNTAERGYKDVRKKAQERALAGFRIPDVLNELLMQKEKILPGIQEEQRGLVEKRDTLVPTKRAELHGQVTDPFAVEAELARQEAGFNRAIDRLQGTEANRKQDIGSILGRGERMYGLETSAAEQATTSAKEALDRALERAKEERDFERQKELKRMDKAGSGSGLSSLLTLMNNPMLAFTKAGGKRIQDASGGFSFYDQGGNPITVEQAASMVPGATKADLLAGSLNKADQETILQSAGKPTVTASAQKDINSISDALNVIKTIEGTSQNINTGLGPTARLGGALRFGKSIIGLDPAATAFRSNVGYLSRVVRAMGEVGTLNEGDIARAKTLIPGIGDTKQEAENKISALRDLLNRNLQQRMNPSILSADPTLQDVVDTGV